MEETEQELANKYDTKVTLYLKDNNTSYKEMHRIICGCARTTLNLLMVDRKPNLEYKKWATFYRNSWTEEELNY